MKYSKIFALAVASSVLFYSNSSSAQNCLSQTDKSTGSIIRIGSVNLPADSVTQSPVLTYQKSEAGPGIGFACITPLPSASFDPEHMSLTFKFVNGTIKNFDSIAGSKVVQIANSTSVVLTSPATDADLDYFAANKVTEILFRYGQNETHTYVVENDLARKIVLTLGCLNN